MQQPTYCADTSSLIHLSRDFPRDVFPSLWQQIEGLIGSGRLIAPREVRKEIELGSDELVRWAKKMRKMFMKPDALQTKEVQDILSNFPNLIDPASQKPQADPFVIALAKVGMGLQLGLQPASERVALTEESKVKANRIPQVCTHFGIRSLNLIELFREENWKF